MTDLSNRRLGGRSIGSYTVVLVHCLQEREHQLMQNLKFSKQRYWATSLLGWDIMLAGKELLTFRRAPMLSSSGSSSLRKLFDPEK